jgi:glutamyl-tRNA(Gln) amidotransferase subunit D
MSGEDWKGYRSPTLDLLKREEAPVWSQVTLHTTRGDFSGLILPRSETADADHISLKLATGYNIGIRHDTVESISVEGRKVANYQIPEKEFPFDPKKPRVKLFGTGGTIASRLDYRTGAVIPAFSPGELYGSVPELADICNMETEKLYGVFSENMGPEQWIGTAEAIAGRSRRGWPASSSGTARTRCTTRPRR